MSIEKYVKAAIKGDDKAFSYLMEINKESLYRTAFAYVKNKEDALDILQETVYKAYISIDKLKEPKYFNTWITRILINNAINLIRKNGKVILLVDNMKENDEFVSDSNSDTKLDLLNAIDGLDDRYKNVIILKYFKDLTINEIAEVLDCPVGTVKTHLNKGLSKLRVFLGEEII
ncbi:RNA polymerase, sigma subunit, SigV [Clostridium cavendishii DSM 21758]|uniref:RNA polymerase, sigma subunit, SigV n=1 Tax=Clostridium cavendishii DSM 21758 TaxID=1121302 RepID=A0A1M6TGV2_9CLOT|nr:sigma-70 family RNA polymerase sigma factor [Clostridium cavendishii]SHK56066.1 RNA polymerase, sigma subunit, SigV [Clostridium cavendishii DSM 21758]